MAKYLVIGASSDIGREICLKALAEGHEVHGTYFSGEEFLGPLQKKAGGKFTASKLDLSNIKDVENFAEKAGAVDALVFCAAVNRKSGFENFTTDDFFHDITANYLSAALITRKIGDLMVKQKQGRILWLGSIGAKFGGGKESFVYALTKHMLEFMPAAAKGWAEHNVLFNTLRVGVTETKLHKGKDLGPRAQMIPMKRAAQPEEIAEYACWLVSDKNTYITAQVLNCAGGE